MFVFNVEILLAYANDVGFFSEKFTFFSKKVISNIILIIGKFLNKNFVSIFVLELQYSKKGFLQIGPFSTCGNFFFKNLRHTEILKNFLIGCSDKVLKFLTGLLSGSLTCTIFKLLFLIR